MAPSAPLLWATWPPPAGTLAHRPAVILSRRESVGQKGSRLNEASVNDNQKNAASLHVSAQKEGGDHTPMLRHKVEMAGIETMEFNRMVPHSGQSTGLLSSPRKPP